MKIRVAASVLLAAALAVGVSGCNFISPQSTLKKYDPSDGVGADLGGLDVRNVMLITEDGTRATLVMSVINLSDEERDLEIGYESSSADAVNGRVSFDLAVDAESIVPVSTESTSDQIVLEDIDAEAGSLFTVFMQTGTAEGVELRVPVLDSTFAEYEDLLPSPSPTPTPTPSPVLEPVPVPVPTEGTVPESTGEATTEGQ